MRRRRAKNELFFRSSDDARFRIVFYYYYIIHYNTYIANSGNRWGERNVISWCGMESGGGGLAGSRRRCQI